MLLRLGHEGNGKISEELISFRQICALSVQVLLECLSTRLIDDLLLLEVRVDAVDAEVDVEFELELTDELLVIMEELGCLSEELLSVALVEQLQDVVLIELAFQLRLVKLHFRS